MTALRITLATAVFVGLAACGAADNPSGSVQTAPRVSAVANATAELDEELRRAMRQASRLEKNQRYDEAIAIYEEQLGPGPNEHVIKNNLAALLLDGRSDKESHQRALELMQPYSAEPNFILQDTLGWAYYRNGDYLKAIRHLEYSAAYQATSALEKPEERIRLSPNVRYHLALAYAKTGITAGAVQELTRAIELAPNRWKHAAEAKQLLAELTQ